MPKGLSFVVYGMRLGYISRSDNIYFDEELKEKMKQIIQRSNVHTISLFVFLVISLGVLCFAAFQGYIDSAMRNANSSMNNDQSAIVMQRQVKKDMQRTEVDALIGRPYECADARTVKIDDKVRETQQCSYGNPDSGEYLNVVYMDDMVWGSSSESDVRRAK